jgi:hypothetical protein
MANLHEWYAAPTARLENITQGAATPEGDARLEPDRLHHGLKAKGRLRNAETDDGHTQLYGNEVDGKFIATIADYILIEPKLTSHAPHHHR